MADIPGDMSTTATVTVGSTTSSSIDTVGDHDFFKITLTAGQSISVAINGVSLTDTYVVIYNSAGDPVAWNDDINPGIVQDSLAAFTATTSGTYYIDVSSFDEIEMGTYQVVVSNYTPPPVGSVADFADQLITDYWTWEQTSPSHFNVTQGGTITVNLTELTAEGQFYAREALKLWSDVIGVTFQEVSTGGQITFDDTDPGAWESGSSIGGFTTEAYVNVSTDWLADYGGGGLNTYAFQTYIHEIGHALGLGHAGDYDGDAAYPTNARYSNDSWAMSVMSYFDQEMNTYVQSQGFTFNYAISPMIADIYAMSLLYGLSTTTRTGNTTYTFSADSGAQTIFDSAGVDTISATDFDLDQLIDLNAGSFSNLYGQNGNIAIALGVTIENAASGAGNDTLIGNDAANELRGNAGNDQLDGGAGDDVLLGGVGNNKLNGGEGSDTASFVGLSGAVTANLGNGTAQNGAGLDQLTSIEHLLGGSGNDNLTGNSGANVLEGGAGNDTLDGTSGTDTVSYEHASGGVTLDLSNLGAQNTVGAGTDTVRNFENVLGSAYADTLRGDGLANTVDGANGADLLYGRAGDDKLYGGLGNDRLQGDEGLDRMYGGAGDDTYIVLDSTDYAYEDAGQGTDRVNSAISLTLRANVENLTLTGTGDLFGKGNALANTITANSGANKLYGYDGDDRLLGGDGNDILDGGTGLDKLYGGAGDDTYVVTDSTDYAYENAGEGTDRVNASVSVTLRANVENLTLTGTSAINGYGNDLANVITGNSAANLLRGADGDDRLYGKDGADIVKGEAGSDWLEGGTGRDRFYGGDGADTFVFREGDFSGVTTSTSDQIHDFSSADGDRIRLNLVDANTGVDGDQAFAFLGTDAFTGTAGELRYEQISGNTYVQGDVDGDGVADFWIRVDGAHSLGAGDFIL